MGRRKTLAPKQRINVGLDAETIARLESIAEQKHLSASAVITRLIWSTKLPEEAGGVLEA